MEGKVEFIFNGDWSETAKKIAVGKMHLEFMKCVHEAVENEEDSYRIIMEWMLNNAERLKIKELLIKKDKIRVTFEK